MHLIIQLKSKENLLWKNLWRRCLNQRKGCEFHYLQSINRHANEVGENSDKIKSLAKDHLYLGAQKAYQSVHEQYEALLGSCRNEKELHNWLQWWQKRHHNIFWAFTGFEYPQMKQAELIHTGWMTIHDREGLLLQEVAEFDNRDSILLGEEIKEFEYTQRS